MDLSHPKKFIQPISTKYINNVQIVAVTPVPSAAHSSLLQSPSRLASWYYKHHRVDHFELIRREFRNESKWTQLEDTETMRLWLHKRVIAIQKYITIFKLLYKFVFSDLSLTCSALHLCQMSTR